MNEAAAPLGSGMPTAPLISHMDQAVFCADIATRAERNAHALACFSRLHAADQVAVLGYVPRGAAS
jgi:hypothetical protein